jgi:hypothetical protein
MKKLSICFLCCIAAIITSCKKLELTGGGGWGGFNFSINSSYFDSYAIDIIRIPAGRYYIYKDAVSGQTDSVIVSQSTDSSAVQQAGPGYPVTYIYSMYKLKLTSVSGAVPQTWFSGSAMSDYPQSSGNISNPVKDSVFSFTNEANNLPAFWYPLQSSGLMQYTFLPSLTIEGYTYTEVHQFSVTNGLPAADAKYQETAFYWVKGTGIIKKMSTTGTSVKTYLLLRYGKI